MSNKRSPEQEIVKRGPAKRWSAAVFTGIAATIAVAAVLSACAGKSGGGSGSSPPSRGSFTE